MGGSTSVVNSTVQRFWIMASDVSSSITGLEPGFFEDWRPPPSPDKRLRMLRNSDHVWLAIDSGQKRVVGLINVITDKTHFAFIPLLQVLPAYQGSGIGTRLVRKMLDTLRHFPCIDLTCDGQLQPFYERCDMQPSVGMIIRDYSRNGPPPSRRSRAFFCCLITRSWARSKVE